MSMEVRPAQTCHVAVLIRTVVSQEEDRILIDLRLLIADPEILVLLVEVRRLEIFVSLLWIVCEDDICGFSSTMRASLCLVQCSQSECANVAGAVIAGRDAVVGDWRGANEAYLGLDIVFVLISTRISALALSARGVSGQASTRDAFSSRLWRRYSCCPAWIIAG